MTLVKTPPTKPKIAAAFPAQVIETCIREFLAQEGAMQAVLHGAAATAGPAGTISPQPVIDSLVVIEILLELETKVPFGLPECLVRAGGYDSVDELVQDLMPKLEQRWNEHHKEKI